MRTTRVRRCPCDELKICIAVSNEKLQTSKCEFFDNTTYSRWIFPRGAGIVCCCQRRRYAMAKRRANGEGSIRKRKDGR